MINVTPHPWVPHVTYPTDNPSDEDITPIATSPPPVDGNTSSGMEEKEYKGPSARSRAKQIQNQVNANLSLFLKLY